MSTSPDRPGYSRVSSVQDAVSLYLDSLDSEGSRTTMKYPLSEFASFCDTAGIDDVAEIEPKDLRVYCRKELRPDVDDEEISASTANTYYNYVRAFLEFCIREELIETNPAKTNRAKELVPEDTGDRDTQYWTDDQRKRITNYVTKRLDMALDGTIDVDPDVAYRDRTLVVLLAETGARGGELFNDSSDRDRTGVTWGDVNFDKSALKVFGKGRKSDQPVPLPADARTALERYQRRIDPPSASWPIFPSTDYLSRRRKLEEEVGEERVSERFEGSGETPKKAFLNELLLEFEVPPPAITKERARQIMKQLTEEARIDVDDRHGYLTLHGARRRLGGDLYEESAERAQDALRHKSIETTHDAYSDLKTEDTADYIDEVRGRKNGEE